MYKIFIRLATGELRVLVINLIFRGIRVVHDPVEVGRHSCVNICKLKQYKGRY